MTPPKFRYIEDDDGRMTWNDFVDDVRRGNLTDYDGIAELATEDKVADVSFDASDVAPDGKPPFPWVTHVVWYNK